MVKIIIFVAVRVTRFIFALYLFSLAVYPCSDEDACSMESCEVEIYASTEEHSHTGAEEDFCTPFCVCSCCATHICITALISMESESPIHNTKVCTLNSERPLINVSGSIWRPPKLNFSLHLMLECNLS